MKERLIEAFKTPRVRATFLAFLVALAAALTGLPEGTIGTISGRIADHVIAPLGQSASPAPAALPPSPAPAAGSGSSDVLEDWE